MKNVSVKLNVNKEKDSNKWTLRCALANKSESLEYENREGYDNASDARTHSSEVLRKMAAELNVSEDTLDEAVG